MATMIDLKFRNTLRFNGKRMTTVHLATVVGRNSVEPGKRSGRLPWFVAKPSGHCPLTTVSGRG
jgi:hypothetical protein